MFSTIREQIETVFRNDPAARSKLEVLLCYPGLHATLLHRLAHWFFTRNFFVIARLISHLSRWTTGIEIHPGARIGQRFFYRSRHGGSDRRDDRDRRRRSAVSGRDPGRDGS